MPRLPQQGVGVVRPSKPVPSKTNHAHVSVTITAHTNNPRAPMSATQSESLAAINRLIHDAYVNGVTITGVEITHSNTQTNP